ncbi:MAG: hypothetical protein KDA99_25815, partial [Planctomycetales bacterium]|nr:hypothetical protein [Planctomycetales bacterium]
MPNVVPTKKASPKGLSLWGEAAYPVDIFRNRFEDWFRRFWQEMSDVAPAPEGAIGTNWECEL